LAGTAGAASSLSGTLVSSELIAESAGPSSATAEAAYWPNASGISSFEVRADHLHLYLAENDQVIAGPARVVLPYNTLPQDKGNYSESMEFDHALVTFAEQPTTGWVAEYDRPSGEPTHFQGTNLQLSVSNQTLGTTPDLGPLKSSDPSIPAYTYAPNHAYVLLSGALTWARDGFVVTQLYGPTVHVSADQGEFTYRTGTRPSTRAEGVMTVSSIFLEAENAHFAAASSVPAQFALSDARLATVGVLQVQGATGTLGAGSGSYLAMNDTAILAGRFDVQAAPSKDAPTLLSSTLRGELDSTTLAFARAPSAPLPGPDLVLPAALLLLGVLVALAVARIRVASKGRHSVDQMAELAYLAADGGRFGEALEWIRTARAHAPSSERLKMDEAWFLAETGEVGLALEIYVALAEGSSSGEADFHAAVLQLQHGQGISAARPHLLRAIQRTPSVVLEMADDPIFAQARQDPELSRAMRLAMRKLDRARDPAA
jgi:hypothetical protein